MKNCEICDCSAKELYLSNDVDKICGDCYKDKLKERQKDESEDDYFERLPFDVDDKEAEEKRLQLLNNLVPIPNKVIVAKYKAYSTFVIPNDIDLESSEIESYGIKWDVLHIQYKNGNHTTITAYNSASDYDFKHPNRNVIQDADDTYEGYEEHIEKKTNL